MQLELAFIGVFPNPYGKDTRKKLEAVAKDRWEPDKEDFLKVINQSKTAKIQDISETENIMKFLGAIVLDAKKKERADKSITRIDLITHSNPEWIALQGTVLLPKTEVARPTVSFPLDDTLDDFHLYKRLSNGVLDELDGSPADEIIVSKPQAKSGQGWKLADIRKKFAPTAKLVLYSCESGVKRTKTSGVARLLSHLAKTLGLTTVGGFMADIRYHPKGEKVLLRLEDYRNTPDKLPPSEEKEDYRQLDSERSYYVEVKPT